METIFFSFVTMILFCVCARAFLQALVQPIPVFATERAFSRGALQMEKAYKASAWGVMTLSFLVGLIYFFLQIFMAI